MAAATQTQYKSKHKEHRQTPNANSRKT